MVFVRVKYLGCAGLMAAAEDAVALAEAAHPRFRHRIL